MGIGHEGHVIEPAGCFDHTARKRKRPKTQVDHHPFHHSERASVTCTHDSKLAHGNQGMTKDESMMRDHGIM